MGLLDSFDGQLQDVWSQAQLIANRSLSKSTHHMVMEYEQEQKKRELGL